MFKKAIFLLFVLFSVCLIHVSSSLSGQTDVKLNKTDIKDVYDNFKNEMIFLKSMSVQYLPHLYPDTLYIGSSYAHSNYKGNKDLEQEPDVLLIDLKWELTEDWFCGVYSEINPKNDNHDNKRILDIDNPMETNFGIVFIHEF